MLCSSQTVQLAPLMSLICMTPTVNFSHSLGLVSIGTFLSYVCIAERNYERHAVVLQAQ